MNETSVLNWVILPPSPFILGEQGADDEST